MSIIVVATIYPMPEHRDAVIAAYSEAIPRVHAEDRGCELYALNAAADRLYMIEKWADREALTEHGDSQALKELRPKTAGKFAKPAEVIICEAIPAGTESQGQL